MSITLERNIQTFFLHGSTECFTLLRILVYANRMRKWHYNVENVFFRSKLREEVYARLPKSCGSLSGRVVKRVRSLYGLRQASRTWHHHLVRGMIGLGFEQCKVETCVFRMLEDGHIIMLLVVHVDDVNAIGTKERCVEFGINLNRYVPTTDVGELRWYAGLRFERDGLSGTIKISQQAMADNIVAKFGVISNRDNQMSVGLKLEGFRPDEPKKTEPFRSLVGHLMMWLTSTRPDIFNAVRAVARFPNSPKWIHWLAILHILMYVRGITGLGITFQRRCSVNFMLFRRQRFR
ncbi:unnamed protein product [Scytosiphon promiscuus]